MRWCVAHSCTNDQPMKDGKFLSYHRFPLNSTKLLDKWLQNVNRDGYKPTKTATLCSEHFEPDCFEEDLYAKYMGRSPGKRPQFILKPDAVPTIFKHKQPSKPRGNSVQRMKEKEKREASNIN